MPEKPSLNSTQESQPQNQESPQIEVSQEYLNDFDRAVSYQDQYFEYYQKREAILDQIKQNYQKLSQEEMHRLLVDLQTAIRKEKQAEDSLADLRINMRPEDSDKFRAREQAFVNSLRAFDQVSPSK